MKRVMIAVLTVGSVWGLSAPVFSAGGTVAFNSETLTLRTNTSGGSCHATLSGGTVELDCDDNAGNRAFGNSAQGCLLTTGTGQCYVFPAPNSTNASSDIPCPGGSTITISTGTNNGTCSTTTSPTGNVTGGNCTDGGNTSNANCSNNNGSGSCGTTTGAGSCSIKK